VLEYIIKSMKGAGRKMLKRIASFILSILFVLGCAVGCSGIYREPQSATYYGLFDSYVTISSYSSDSEEEFLSNCEAIHEMLRKYNKLFDIYREYNGINNLCTVNREAGKSPVEVDGDLLDFIDFSIQLSIKTDLEVNIAMGSVLKLWHDARESANEDSKPYLPEKSALESAFAHTDIESIVIDRENSTIFITDPETQIDVGAIAKGYAAQKAADLLRSRNADGYILDLGGNIVAVGTREKGKGWTTGIRNPDKNSSESFIAKIEISNVSCVTSGDYERYFSFNGKDYHHIIDKDTLEPAAYFRSVTVLCSDSATADALSTALFCMSIEDGKKLISRFNNVEVVWVLYDGSIQKTDGVKILAQ